MPTSTRAIKLRRPDVCARCGCELGVGQRAIWDARVREAQCRPCGDTWSGVPEPHASVAGAGAQRAQGSEGEREAGRVLEKKTAGRGVVLLHDRRLPGSRANVDHLAIGRAGVFVIDTKRYEGRIGVERRGGLLRPRTSHLVVGGRDRTTLIDGVLGQAAIVREMLEASVPVMPVLCFVDGDWPLRARLEVRGVPILWPRQAAKLCRGHGPLAAERVQAVADGLAARLPVA